MPRPSLFVAAVLTATLCASALAEDARTLVKLPPPMAEHMLANMRDHLGAINEIQSALGTGEFQRASDIAERRLGLSSLAAHGAAHMAPFMPGGMQEIGTQMHKAASRFALTAQEAGAGGSLGPAVTALAAVTAQCVACHAAYRAH
jgi:hypothetical protein